MPGRLGEIAKPVLLGRREGISKTAAFATVVLERLFDLMCILLMLVAYLLVFPLPSALDSEGAEVLTLMRASGFAALGALVVAVMFMAGAQRWPERTDILLTRVLGFVPGRAGDALVPVARSFLEGFAGLRDPKLLAIIALHSILIWVNVIVTYWIMFLAFDIEAPYYAVLPLLVLVVIGVMVPTPAAVGAFHAAVRIALVTLWGVPNEQAVSYAILTHAMAFVPITVIGLLALLSEGGADDHFVGGTGRLLGVLIFLISRHPPPACRRLWCLLARYSQRCEMGAFGQALRGYKSHRPPARHRRRDSLSAKAIRP